MYHCYLIPNSIKCYECDGSKTVCDNTQILQIYLLFVNVFLFSLVLDVSKIQVKK